MDLSSLVCHVFRIRYPLLEQQNAVAMLHVFVFAFARLGSE